MTFTDELRFFITLGIEKLKAEVKGMDFGQLKQLASTNGIAAALARAELKSRDVSHWN